MIKKMMTKILSKSRLVVFVTAFAAFLLGRLGRWRRRAADAERDLRDHRKTERKSSEIQNRIMFDPAYRERVRREFDKS